MVLVRIRSISPMSSVAAASIADRRSSARRRSSSLNLTTSARVKLSKALFRSAGLGSSVLYLPPAEDHEKIRTREAIENFHGPARGWAAASCICRRRRVHINRRAPPWPGRRLDHSRGPPATPPPSPCRPACACAARPCAGSAPQDRELTEMGGGGSAQRVKQSPSAATRQRLRRRGPGGQAAGPGEGGKGGGAMEGVGGGDEGVWARIREEGRSRGWRGGRVAGGLGWGRGGERRERDRGSKHGIG